MHRCAFVAFFLFVGTAISGETWPQWRGPEANGHTDATELPLKWDASAPSNIVWKTEIHDRGWSSPVIWNKQVWMTTSTADGRKLFAVCVDRDSGKVIHDLPVFDVDQPEPIAAMNSYASPTGAIEAGRVYVHYGTYGTACIDTETRKILWSRRDLKCDHHEGAGSSATLVDDLLIFNVDGRDVQYVIALNKLTGETVWKTDRSADFSNRITAHRKCYATPIVVQTADRKELFSVGAAAVVSYDIATGKELWKVSHRGWSVAPRPVSGDGTIFMINDYDRPEMWAVKAGGYGDVTNSHVLWKQSRAMPSRPSPVLVGDLLFTVSSDGILSCLETDTGNVIKQQRIGTKFSASPIHANDRIYFFDESSNTTVVEPTRELKVLSVNRLNEEQLMASPAAVGRSLFIRTISHLYRVEQAK